MNKKVRVSTYISPGHDKILREEARQKRKTFGSIIEDALERLNNHSNQEKPYFRNAVILDRPILKMVLMGERDETILMDYVEYAISSIAEKPVNNLDQHEYLIYLESFVLDSGFFDHLTYRMKNESLEIMAYHSMGKEYSEFFAWILEAILKRLYGSGFDVEPFRNYIFCRVTSSTSELKE